MKLHRYFACLTVICMVATIITGMNMGKER